MKMNNIYYRSFEKLEEAPLDIIVPVEDEKWNYTKEEALNLNDKKERIKAEKLQNKAADFFGSDWLLWLNATFKSFYEWNMDNQIDLVAKRNESFRKWYNWENWSWNAYSKEINRIRKESKINRWNLNWSSEQKWAKYIAERLWALGYFWIDGKTIDYNKVDSRKDKNLLFAIQVFQRCSKYYQLLAGKRYQKVDGKETKKIDMVMWPIWMLALVEKNNSSIFDPSMISGIDKYKKDQRYELDNLLQDIKNGSVKEKEEDEIKTYKTLSLSDDWKTVELEINSKAPFEAKDVNRYTILWYDKDAKNGNKFTKIIALEWTYTINYDANASTEATAWKLDFTAAEKKDNTPETFDLTNDLLEIDKSVATIFDDKKKSKNVTIVPEWTNNKKADFTYENIHYTILYNTSDKSYVLESWSEILSKTGNDYTLGQTTIANTKNMDVKSKDKVINVRIMLWDLAKTFTAIEPEAPKYTVENYNQEFDKLEWEWKAVLTDINRTTLSSTEPDQVAKQDSKAIEGTKATIQQAIAKLSPLRDKALALKDKYTLFKTNKNAKNADQLWDAMDKNIKYLEKLPWLIDDKAKLETLVKQYNTLISEWDAALWLYKEDKVQYAWKLDEAEWKFKDAQKIETQIGKTGVNSKLQEIAIIKNGLVEEKANKLQAHNKDYELVLQSYNRKKFDIASALPTEVNAASLKSLETAMQVISDYEAHIKEYELKIIWLQSSYEGLSDNKWASNPSVLTEIVNKNKEEVWKRRWEIEVKNQEFNEKLRSNFEAKIKDKWSEFIPWTNLIHSWLRNKLDSTNKKQFDYISSNWKSLYFRESINWLGITLVWINKTDAIPLIWKITINKSNVGSNIEITYEKTYDPIELFYK